MKKGLTIKKIILLCFGLCLLSFTISCEKNTGTDIYKVWYLLEVPAKFDVKINYNSDKYAAMGTMDTIHYTDTTYSPYTASLSENSSKIKVWVGNHAQRNHSLPYFIEAQFSSYTQFDNTAGKKYVMMVFANDTTLLDSIQFTPTFGKVKLSGDIPKNF